MSAEELRRGPWTFEEDTLLIRYIASHGEGHWNLLARCSGLKRTGKSCRLRWLNYLKPDIKRGNLTPQEKFTISELHSKWGNRYCFNHMPGRTDNEIKNYWRTRTQNQARELKRAESERFLEPVSVHTFSVPTVNQSNEDTNTTTAMAVNDHHSMSSSSPPRNTAFPSQDGGSSNSMLPPTEQPYKPISPGEIADSEFYNYKYASDPECYYSLEDLSFATMSPIRADDSGLFQACHAAGDNWMDREDDMTESDLL